MTRHRQAITGFVVAIVVCAAVAAYSLLFGPIFKHRTEIAAARTNVRAINKFRLEDVQKIWIDLGDIGGQSLVLEAEQDSADIKRVLDSLKRIKVADRECRAAHTDDTIVVFQTSDGKDPSICKLMFWGHFNPDRAPIISKSMRSDDLGRIIYDIYERRGIKPRGK